MTPLSPVLRTLASLPASGMTTAQYRTHLAGLMTEAELQTKVRELAARHGWRSYHTRRSDGSDKGWPDLVLVHREQRRVLYRELKTQTGRVRPEQHQWLDLLAAAGGDAGIWRPEDLLEQRIHHTLRSTP